MTRGLEALTQAPWDVVIIGGGIVGTGVARDAALRGLRVALIEQSDFGGGTTAASTRLIHGGLRYLETFDFRLVRLDLREREILLRIAPHLVAPLPFLLPLYGRHLFERLKIQAGMLLYDALSFDKSLPQHQMLSRDETARLEPALRRQGLEGGAVYHDAQVRSPERLALENVLHAEALGATVMNYVAATGPLTRKGELFTLGARDAMSGEQATLQARVIVNTTGPWLDTVAMALTPQARRRVRMTKGIHLACAPFTHHALILPSHRDGRIVFAIPWGGHTWVGTTDTDFAGDPSTARATAEDVAYLRHAVSEFVPAGEAAHAYWSCAGVRALAQTDGAPSKASRMHEIVEDASGVIAVVGGKITGYRAIAAEVTDHVCRRLSVTRQCRTATIPLPGAAGAPTAGASTPSAHLRAIYGSRAAAVAALALTDARLAEPLTPDTDDIAAQVVFSVREESCRRLEDFLLRRSYLGFGPDRGRGAMDAVSHLMGQQLQWPEAQRQAELDAYRARIADVVHVTTSGASDRAGR